MDAIRDAASDISIRAFKTFIQVAIPGLLAVAVTDWDVATLQTAAWAGAAAAVSVIMNAALAWANTD